MACTNFRYDDKNVVISGMHKLSKKYDDKNVIISGMHKLQTAPTTGLTLKKKIIIHIKLQHLVTTLHMMLQLTWTIPPAQKE